MGPRFLAIDDGMADAILRIVFVCLAAVVFVYYSSLLEREYHQKLTLLYVHPWWRFLVVFLVLSSAVWCPQVGLLLAAIALFYLSDMNTLVTPLPHL